MSKTSYLCVVMLNFECPVCQPNLYRSAVFSAEFCSFRKNSANPNISRKICSASRIIKKNPAEGSDVTDERVAQLARLVVGRFSSVEFVCCERNFSAAASDLTSP